MTQLALVIDLNVCVGCHACVTSCKEWNTSGEAGYMSDDRPYGEDPTGTFFNRVQTFEVGDLYVRAFKDGQWGGEEIALSRDNSFGKSRLYFGEWDMHTQPAWMPDGKELLFVSNRNVAFGSGDVMRMPVEPDGIRKATSVLHEQTLYRTRPHVSPDGARFIYASTGGASDEYTHLYILPTKGGENYRLTFGNYDNFHPRWSHGEWIAYISNMGGLPGLWLLETYGGEKKNVRITARRWRRPMGMVRVRVIDQKTRRNRAPCGS